MNNIYDVEQRFINNPNTYRKNKFNKSKSCSYKKIINPLKILLLLLFIIIMIYIVVLLIISDTTKQKLLFKKFIIEFKLFIHSIFN